MKKVTQQFQPEKAEFICDFTDKALKDFVPATLVMDFGYESDFDGSNLTLHLSESASYEVLEFIKCKLSLSSKQCMSEQVKDFQKSECEAIQFRDWLDAEHSAVNLSLYSFLLS